MDLVLDLIGGETHKRSFALLKSGGALISSVEEPDKARAAKRQLKVERFMAKPSSADLREIGALIDGGQVKVTLAKTYPLAEVADAHRFIEDEHPRGKVVLIVE
jgi:NADPH:quinone reductase-like Zn-dependent oxidoreductase